MTLERFDADALRSTVATYRDLLKAHADRLNRLNVYPVPDGDTGTNMARTLDAVVEELDGAGTDLAATCAAVSHGSLMGARGNSGVILSQVLRGIAGTLGHTGDGSASTFGAALTAASTAAYQAVLKPIEGTILTVVRASADAGAAVADEPSASVTDVLRAAREAAATALERTPELLPVLRDAGVVDAGGAGYLLLLDAALHVVAGDPLPEAAAAADGPSPAQLGTAAHRAAHDAGPGGVDVSELRYEVMYFLDLDDERIDAFKQGWGEIGDSIVVVGGDGLWNCHVHTNDIGAAIETALTLDGRPSRIRVTDLFEEVAEEHAAREAAVRGGPRAAVGGGLPPVTCAVVAVASGDGLVELFAALGVQGVVTGGQTLNPSTAELLDAVNTVNAQQVVVLPNNKNIIPVAEQLDALTDKTVVVVPSTSMPAALAALVVYDPEAGAAANGEQMTAAVGSLVTGELTRAVRATHSDAGEIAEGDWIGIVRGDGIVAVGLDIATVATRLLAQLIDESSEIATVVTGSEATEATTAAIVAWLGAEHPDVQVEVHRGGQPLYPYLFGVE
jgi:DAK2 domain fusion protein YloV